MPPPSRNKRAGRYFAKFTPNQSKFYLKNLGRQIMEAMFLNSLLPYSAYQVAALVLVQFYFSMSIARDKPCTRSSDVAYDSSPFIFFSVFSAHTRLNTFAFAPPLFGPGWFGPGMYPWMPVY